MEKNNIRVTKLILTTLCLAWALITLYFFFTNPSVRLGVLMCMLKRVYQLGLLSFILFLSAGIGMRLIRNFKVVGAYPHFHGDKFMTPAKNSGPLSPGGEGSHAGRVPTYIWLYSIGIGLGGLSYITLLLGLLGIMEKWVYFIILGILTVFTKDELIEFCQYIFIKIKGVRESKIGIFNLILLSLFGLSIILNLFGAFTPEVHYDALEYHFGAPGEFLRDGRIHFLQHNVYSNFPSLVEMLYLLGMLIEGDTLAKLFHWTFGILTSLSILSFGKRLFGIKIGLIGMAIFYVFGQITILSTQALVDMGVAFYSFLGIMAIIEWVGTEKRGWLLLSGISIGLAVSCKYPAILSFLAIEVLILFHTNWVKRLKTAVLFALIVLLTSSPWFIKNFIWTRNPVYPLFYNVFDGKNWDNAKDERFQKAHAPGKKDLITLVRTLWDMTIKDQFMTPIFLLFIPLIIFLKGIDRHIKYLLVYLALFYLFWFYFTHRIDRFFLPATPALALVSGYIYMRLNDATRVLSIGIDLPIPHKGRVLRGFLSIILVFSLLFNFYISAFTLSSINPFAYAFGFETKDEFLTRTLPPYSAMKFINDELDEDAVVLLMGEAEVHYINRKVLYNTVFDTSIIEEIVNTSTSPEEVLEKVKGLGATHLLLNRVEVARLNRTYSYMKDFNWELFYDFEKEYLEKIYSLEEKVLIYKVKR